LATGEIMSKIESIEQQIEKLSSEELAAFRRWYAAFDAEVWDRQFETDVKAGKLDALGDKALGAHTLGRSTKI
jgi:hypothetical protein